MKSRFWISLLMFTVTLLAASCQTNVFQRARLQDEIPEPSQQLGQITSTPFVPQQPTATQTIAVTPTITPLPCELTGGQIVEYQIEHPELIESVIFRVYEPPCYGTQDRGAFPVLYMLHGQTFTDDQWQRLGIMETADQLIAEGLMPPFLIVMPLEHDSFADIFESEFSRSVLDVLIPWVDNNYDTCSSRECRAIGGLSRGGAWAIHLGFSYWTYFGSVGAHSTPAFVGDLYRLQGWVPAIPPEQLPRVYMDIGRSDIFRPYAEELDLTLTSLTVPHEWVIFEGEHNEEYWRSNIRSYLLWYSMGWSGLFENQ